MSLLTTLARAEAVAGGRAVAAATVRHRYLGAEPVVFVPLTTAGEAGAPLGAMIGTRREEPELLVVPQPLDRDLRFAFFAGLARVLLPLLAEYEDRTETEPATRNREESEVCADALQIVVPNSASADYVRLLGRSTRFLRTVEDPDAPHPVPVPVPLVGRWLTHYAERARTPGSALLLAMTDLLTRHWTTGQSAMEDQHLGALLGWIDPPPGLDGPGAAARAETGRGPDGLLLSPPAGPATDPVFDNRVLAPAMSRYDRARDALRAAEETPGAARARAELAAATAEVTELVAGQLRPAWDDVWHGLDLLRELPEAAHVAERWKRDRWSFTGHRDRLRAGEPPQPRRDDAVTAAQKLAGRETAQARLLAQEALDDPLAMAARRLAGEAFAGEVVAVEMAWSEGRRPMPRPLVTVVTGDLPQAEPGAKAYRALPEARSAQSAELVALEEREQEPGRPADRLVTVRLTGGMGSGRTPKEGSVPAPGDQVIFTLFEHEPRGGPALPEAEDTPWTHGGPPGRADAPQPPDPVTAEDFL
ncbi:hypothetical protein [Actinacidiphila acididurans]|uniref:Uncharacterized protein n=1 Tax=Actinacidiphila acididurans TaxID=2784346 RepID=A0ABS2TZJ4_9ACTN|nr:hypothetical protein [Actinacidiphila acididurans]MBM9508758.1 hypothetical protein [Actinacidiphila acididurans]